MRNTLKNCHPRMLTAMRALAIASIIGDQTRGNWPAPDSTRPIFWQRVNYMEAAHVAAFRHQLKRIWETAETGSALI